MKGSKNISTQLTRKLKALSRDIEGEGHFDHLHRILYATDASVYRELPLGVVYPRHEPDLVKIIDFCSNEKIPVIPRAAGTSLAGQVVGNGLVCDTSRYLTSILEIDEDTRRVTVEPGVIRDILNIELAEKGLFFGPNTSTSNRCNIGGMIGNNSCGTTSIRYGTTRDKIISVRAVTADGRVQDIGPVTLPDVSKMPDGIYKSVLDYILEKYDDAELISRIKNSFPSPDIHRRNTGYALDDLCRNLPFDPKGKEMNLARLLCGSEGTLALTASAVLQLDPLPPPRYSMVTLEFNTVREAMQNVGPAMKFLPYQCELMDDVILECTRTHPKYSRYLGLIKTEPRALLMVEFREISQKDLLEKTQNFEKEMRSLGLCQSISINDEHSSDQLWELRKAGLGLLANLEGDQKAIACIEDTAVSLSDLPDYIDDFEDLMKDHGQRAVYYAHAGAGELHLRPILNLKTPEGKAQFHDICRDSARLVKKYNGSLSGEHGDGRVRAPFIEEMVGTEVYKLFVEMKDQWDPENIFNPGKIVRPEPLVQDLRYETTEPVRTRFNFESDGGLLGMAERCNGSGDCRKLSIDGGTMCPSYHATREEKDTTRARANALRDILIHDDKENRFDNDELKEVLDLCLSCKGCQKECPSNVDVAVMKSEFQYQYYKDHRRPVRDILFTQLTDAALRLPALTSWASGFANSMFGKWIKPVIGIHPERRLPQVTRTTWYEDDSTFAWDPDKIKEDTVVLFCDEFTNHFEKDIGRKAIELLSVLDCTPMLSPPMNSARALISKGFLEEAWEMVNRQFAQLKPLIDKKVPLVGIEPSAILSLRDEWKRLIDPERLEELESLNQRVYTIEEFLSLAYRNGEIGNDNFRKDPVRYHVHAHCHFKAQCEENDIYHLMDIVPGAEVSRIPSGCCGMAGSFGYEKEHYDVSMKVGEQELFPYLRNIGKRDSVIANGTSCRHQIEDALQIGALHPVEALWSMLK